MYDKDYLEYDDIGLSAVNCMRCNQAVKRRAVVTVEAKDVLVIKTLSHFKPTPYHLSDGSYTNILLCKDCHNTMEDDSQEELDGMTQAA